VNEHELAELLEGADAEQGDAPDRDRPGSRVAAARMRNLLADEAVWAEPPPSGIDDLLAAIATEREAGSGAATPARAGGPGPGEPRVEPITRPAAPEQRPGVPAHRATRPPARRRLALVAAAAVVAITAGAAGFLLRGTDEGGGREVEVAGTELAPDASATARVEETGSGVAIELDVRDLPPAPEGMYYQGWLRGPDGLVTVGTFHVREGDDTVDLWSGVPLDRYPTLTVTLQQEGAGQESSGQVVLMAEIGP
jgi:hypothetical protein